MTYKERISQPIGTTSEPDSPFISKPTEDTGSSAAITCSYNGSTYQKGEHICINHDHYECGKGGWFRTGCHC
jgi:hypothetical protein